MKRVFFVVVCILWINLTHCQIVSLRDTTIIRELPGCIVQYQINNSNEYKIYWYNDTLSNVSALTYTLINGGLLEIADVTEKYVVLFKNCGQKDKLIVTLPLKKAEAEMLFEKVIGYDSVNKNILYLSNDTGAILISAHSLINGRETSVMLKGICTATNLMECIDDVHYETGKILIRYYSGNDNHIQIEELDL